MMTITTHYLYNACHWVRERIAFYPRWHVFDRDLFTVQAGWIRLDL